MSVDRRYAAAMHVCDDGEVGGEENNEEEEEQEDAQEESERRSNDRVPSVELPERSSSRSYRQELRTRSHQQWEGDFYRQMSQQPPPQPPQRYDRQLRSHRHQRPQR